MENSDGKLNELISDLSEPARSTVMAIVLLQKIPNQIIIVKTKVSAFFLKSTTKSSYIETDASHVEFRSGQEARQFALHNNPNDSLMDG